MTPTRRVTLHNTTGTSNKVYELELQEGDDGWVVVARWGRIGATLREGTKTDGEVELAAAAEGGASFATVSPIYPTSSKPGYGPALGPDVFARLAPLAPDLPLYALGGLTPERARACIARGAHGAAAMSSIISDPALAAAFPHDTII